MDPSLPLASPPFTAEEYAYEKMRSAIVTGELAAGTRVIQSELAAEYGISVTPIREALRRLESDGLVEHHAHRGATVKALSKADARDIYGLRMMLEPNVVEHVTGIGPAQLDRAAELVTAMDQVTRPTDFIRLNQDFHNTLTIADASWTSRIVGMLRAAAAPYVGLSLQFDPDLMRTSNEEHRQLVDAFRRDDRVAMREITLHHLSTTMVVLERAMLE